MSWGGGRQLTAGFAPADGPVGGIVQVSSDVADFGVDEALACKVLAVEVLGAPEAACCDGASLRARGDGAWCGGGVGHGEAGGVGEGSGEAGDEVGEVVHVVSLDDIR